MGQGGGPDTSSGRVERSGVAPRCRRRRLVAAAALALLTATVPSVDRVHAASVVEPYDDTSASYTGTGWVQSASTSAYFLSRDTRSNVVGATATFTFTGTKVAWRGVRGNSYGRAEVRIDGADPVIVDSYASTTSNQAVLWSSPVLTDGTHTIRITVTDKNASSSNGTISVDRFDVTATLFELSAAVETQPVGHSGDAADDPAIWVNPVDPARSTIIGTDKLGGARGLRPVRHPHPKDQCGQRQQR